MPKTSDFVVCDTCIRARVECDHRAEQGAKDSCPFHIDPDEKEKELLRKMIQFVDPGGLL